MAPRPFLSLMLLLFAAGVVNAAVAVLSPSTGGDDAPACSACGPLGCEWRPPTKESAVDQP